MNLVLVSETVIFQGCQDPRRMCNHKFEFSTYCLLSSGVV